MKDGKPMPTSLRCRFFHFGHWRMYEPKSHTVLDEDMFDAPGVYSRVYCQKCRSLVFVRLDEVSEEIKANIERLEGTE